MPYDEKTGKHYDYTEEGIEQYKKDTGKGMPMKNMAYWKNKNTLPGIDPMSDENLPDGRSLSAPFQKKK